MSRAPRMTAEQAFKKRFVERKLLPMLEAATDGAVTELRYMADRDDEKVIVRIERVPFPPLKKIVNVSLDSKLAIVKDVMRAVEEIYG